MPLASLRSALRQTKDTIVISITQTIPGAPSQVTSFIAGPQQTITSTVTSTGVVQVLAAPGQGIVTVYVLPNGQAAPTTVLQASNGSSSCILQRCQAVGCVGLFQRSSLHSSRLHRIIAEQCSVLQNHSAFPNPALLCTLVKVESQEIAVGAGALARQADSLVAFAQTRSVIIEPSRSASPCVPPVSTSLLA